MRHLVCWSFVLVLASLSFAAEPSDLAEGDQASEAPAAEKRETPRIRVDVAFLGRGEDADPGFIGSGIIHPLEMRCYVRQDLRSDSFLLWISIPASAKNLFRFWRDVNKTVEVLPQVEGDFNPFDQFPADSLPEMIWVDTFGGGTGSISLRGMERRERDPNEI